MTKDPVSTAATVGPRMVKNGEQRVAELVAPDDLPVPQSLGARRPDVVGIHDLEHARAHVSSYDGHGAKG